MQIPELGILLGVVFAVIGVITSVIKKDAAARKKKTEGFQSKSTSADASVHPFFKEKADSPRASQTVVRESVASAKPIPEPPRVERVTASVQTDTNPFSIEKDDLVKAIVYAEILGKPKALRR